MSTELPVHSIDTTASVAPAGLHGPAPSPEHKALLISRVRFLVAFTIAYNVIEAVVALTAGSIAGSAALLGFGLDSVIEVSSALAVAWQFAGGDHEAREKVALRVIAFSFFGLAAFVKRADQLAEKYGDRFRPTQYLCDLAAKGEGFPA